MLSLLALALVSDSLVRRPPAELGMSGERLEAITRVVNKGIAAGGFPGAAVVVGRRGGIVYERGFGRQTWSASSRPVSTSGTIYDLASLTKVIATTTAAMVLIDDGRLRLDDKVQKYVPDFAGRWKEQVTVRMLLAHSAGIPPGREIWRTARSPAHAREMAVTTRLNFRPGYAVDYSDLGADILGWVVEAAARQPLDRFVGSRVFGPLGMQSTMFRPPAPVKERVAPTEQYPPRGYPLRGEVHDENAFALGGVAGHAGLFGTAADLAVFAQMMLNRGVYNGVRIVADSTVRLFTGEVARGRALGWEVGSGQRGAGEHLDKHAYGHTGFTGTSLWIDPDREIFVVLLTNRIHEPRARRASYVISDVRNDVTDAAVMSVLDPQFATAAPVSLRSDRARDWNRRGARRPDVERTGGPHRGTTGPSLGAPTRASADSGTGRR